MKSTNIPNTVLRTASAYIRKRNDKGQTVNCYSPLQNLTNEDEQIGQFTTVKLNFDLEHPVDIIPQDSYDGSVNLIMNDGKNPPRLINSRFSIQDQNTFLIPDHTGFKDTNIYSTNTFDVDTRLKMVPIKIPNVVYNGLLESSGNMKCGTYNFFFKFADSDGNESEVVAESGMVQCHIGSINSPNSIRMGMEDENTGKAIHFTLTNIDAGCDYVHVLFSRMSSGVGQGVIPVYQKVIYDFPVTSDGTCDIKITGSETIIGSTLAECTTNYADLDSVKTQTTASGLLIFGNTSTTYHDWDAIQQFTWKIIPYAKQLQEGGLPTISNAYGSIQDIHQQDFSQGYYNTKNTYYHVGYWPEEIYRFGIVYIFEDNSLSPVIALQGVDLSKLDNLSQEGTSLTEYEKAFFMEKNRNYYPYLYSPSDGFFNAKFLTNSKGVIRFPKKNPYRELDNQIILTPMYLSLDFSKIGYEQDGQESFEQVFKKHKIKGYFVVRQKRVPTILGQGVMIGLTDKEHGALPFMQDENHQWRYQSFLNSDRLLGQEAEDRRISNTGQFTINAMLMPDAELGEAVYNDLFPSEEYSVHTQGTLDFEYHQDIKTFVSKSFSDFNQDIHISKITNVPAGSQTLTDGELYFSSYAGNAHEPYKTADIEKIWDKTKPQHLTESTTLLRGEWGSYVGVGNPVNDPDNNPYSFGQVVNIKAKNFSEDQLELFFTKAMNNSEYYHPITHRTEIKETEDCFRGDCFVSLYTHRLFKNFIDPELPTNHKIVNPICWAQNYGVRCTCIQDAKTHSNMTNDNEGWYIDDNGADLTGIVPLVLSLLTGNIFTLTASIVDLVKVNTKAPREYKGQDTYANEIVVAFEEYTKGQGLQIKDEDGQPVSGADFLSSSEERYKKLKKLNPKEQEQQGGFNLKALFKSEDNWELRGISQINRADVNAVGLGQWATFPICSSRNLCMRDVDFSQATEQAALQSKRSFYPLKEKDVCNPQADSTVINAATGYSIPTRPYALLPDSPYFKQEYFTRVYNSNIDNAKTVTNEWKNIGETSYQDYEKKYGSITKIVSCFNNVFVVFKHGIGLIKVDITAESPSNYLFPQLQILSDVYGSMWKDSVVSTNYGVFGVDSVAKVIWHASGEGVTPLSDATVGKFLVDNIDMSEFEQTPYIGHINIKTHFNAFKRDLIFTYYNDKLYKYSDECPSDKYSINADGYYVSLNNPSEIMPVKAERLLPKYNEDTQSWQAYSDLIQGDVDWVKGTQWSLCYNLDTRQFTTFYDWIPLESENIDNIYFSFDKDYQEAPQSIPLKCTTENLNIKINKHDIDPAFNNWVDIYKIKDYSWLPEGVVFKAPSDVLTGNTGILSFYVKSDNKWRSVLKCGSTSLYEAEIPEGDWVYVYCIISSNNSQLDNLSLLVPKNIDIADPKMVLYNKNNIPQDIASMGTGFHYLQKENGKFNKLHQHRAHGNQMPIWKHGQAGLYDNQGEIKPTNWYGKQHEFNFEFVVNGAEGAGQNIYNNLKLISNKTEPYKFEYEVVGESYQWFEYKPIIFWINEQVSKGVFSTLEEGYKEVLSSSLEELKSKYQSFPKINIPDLHSLPFLKIVLSDKKGLPSNSKSYLKTDAWADLKDNHEYDINSSEAVLVKDLQLNEYRIRTEQLGQDIYKVGRLRGNMQYLEDLWDIEIRPINFKWAYINDKNNLEFKDCESRHRDKYIKIKIRYTGEDLALIKAVLTQYSQSFA